MCLPDLINNPGNPVFSCPTEVQLVNLTTKEIQEGGGCHTICEILNVLNHSVFCVHFVWSNAFPSLVEVTTLFQNFFHESSAKRGLQLILGTASLKSSMIKIVVKSLYAVYEGILGSAVPNMTFLQSI